MDEVRVHCARRPLMKFNMDQSALIDSAKTPAIRMPYTHFLNVYKCSQYPNEKKMKVCNFVDAHNPN